MLGQNVLLVGLGESGLACARWALMQGARLTIVDSRENPPGLDALKEKGQDFLFVSNPVELKWPYDQVCVSPGLSPKHELMRAVVAQAQVNEVQIDSELDWFADGLARLKQERHYTPKVVSVTGTNGKTTTVKMTACLASHAGRQVQCAGNVSPAALEALRLAIEEDTLPDVWVLELSSFQLHWTKRLYSDASTVLNVSEDHLDWHASMQEYASDKAKIFSAGSVCLFNRDDREVMKMQLPEQARLHSFGTGSPTDWNQFGLVRDGGLVWLAMTGAAPEQTGRRKRATDRATDKVAEDHEVRPKLLMPMDALKVFGLHNASNALAALALCRAIDLPMAGLLHGLRAYEGEPHRVQFVRSLEGVEFFDDSKGTNVGATIAALNGLARKTILIAGGQGKGQNFNPMVQPVSQYCKSMVVLGQDAALLERVFSQTVTTHRVTSMQEAVETAFSLASEGDCVLLSPACASLDMFKNYVARAEAFIEAVAELAMKRGQVC
ncbi:MAG: UDP-N-acetylmuramoyl-L-alanine--D-glutamate ligase [Limnobacter sp.]|nr:UDP-N-acetylmuramoyl-L-alanine--D-glutamate ligase [Limnobacter sp.]